MKSVLLDVEKRSAKAVDIVPELDTLYKLLNCDLIDVTYRKVGDKMYCIVCDDEGLLKEGAIVSGVEETEDGDIRPMLVGNLLFFSEENTEDGDFVGLTDEDVQNILEHMLTLVSIDKRDDSAQLIRVCSMSF